MARPRLGEEERRDAGVAGADRGRATGAEPDRGAMLSNAIK